VSGGPLPPGKVVASFDSATILHAALAAALRGRSFPHLGNSAAAAAAMRIGGHLPWPLLRRLYTRIGAGEGIDPERLGDVDLAGVAQWLTEKLPNRRYPAALIGSSNGALMHLAAGLQIPWLPGTVLIPVSRTGDPERPVDALRFGERFGPRLLKANPDVVLHHMHDQVQDELMVARMSYFRVKWRRLPDAYARFLENNLASGAPVIVVEDESSWPVVRVSDRHVFQSGAQGGVDPAGYLDRPNTPAPDGEAAEAEWGADPSLSSSLTEWSRRAGHPLLRLRYCGPQRPSAAVADTYRHWLQDRAERATRLLVSSFVLADPWRTINSAAVPFWTFFPVIPALQNFEQYLQSAPPFDDIDILMFQHGVTSTGYAAAERWLHAGRRTGANTRLIAVDPRKAPHDVGSLGRYGTELAELPVAQQVWSPMRVDAVLTALAGAGLPAVPVHTGQ
jgi:hypothetical protein